MNNKIIDKLVELEVFSSKRITKDVFEKENTSPSNSNRIFTKGSYKNPDGTETECFREIDTKGLTSEEIQLLLDIDRTENIRSIKNMVIFFVVLAVISIIISIWSGVSVANML